jgi:hypothetical protein
MARPSLDVDELVEHWTVLDEEQGLVAGKRGSTRLAFALSLKFYTRWGRFPQGGQSYRMRRSRSSRSR